MQKKVKFSLVAIGWSLVLPALAQATFYEREGFGGRSFSTSRALSSLDKNGFNDRAFSAVVQKDGWEVCEDARFNGRCMVLRQGRCASLSATGLNDRISSVRPVSGNTRVEEDRYAPPPYRLPNDVVDYRPSQNERMFEADVVAVHAVVGTPDNQGNRVTTRDVQRCSTTSASSRPEYWDVTYNFRGVDHRVQMMSAPGPTITVNRDGVPRS